ncbi:rho GTPase-activating protein 24 isoform X3 [Denticeps clupeoides]|uniref:Rho-GAP domain-containing protein n=1 Tax=Denticeps clupeoides TaxID=299321 RepID=A0AAY4CHX6_9TELE|nr:rho GTPase-activating protein 24-like isoform X3 [Denticeps clupeoides]
MMLESKHKVYRTNSHLSHSAYRKIKRVLSFRRRVFGQRLEETVLYERRYGVHMAPLVVEQCADFIRERGLLEVGLFRQPGQATLVKELQEAFDAGEKPSFNSSTDVHTVASLLKLYLRELPEPVVPFVRYQDFLMCGKQIPQERKQALLELRNLLYELPVANFNLLKYICQFLSEVQSYSSSNKMSIQNLATVFGPNILRPKAEDPESIIGGAAAVQQLMSELIREQCLLFSRDGDAEPQKKPRHHPVSTHPQPSNYVEWVRTEHDPQQHECESLSPPHQMTRPCSRQLSLPLSGESPKESGTHLPPMPFKTYGTTCYKSHSPSESGCQSPTSGHHAPPARPQSACSTATAVLEGPEQAGSRSSPRHHSWSTEKEQGGHSGSSDAQDSTLSVYDNMDTMELVTDAIGDADMAATGSGGRGAAVADGSSGSMADSSSSWSSCEILFVDEPASVPNGNGVSSPVQDSISFFSSFRTEPGDEEPHPNSPASSSAPTDAVLSTGSSEVFLPAAPADPHAPTPTHALRCLLAGLRQQMEKQKVEYETRITRLERRNEALRQEVSGLRGTLEQQRRCVSAAEVKMRNVERARADAERRNGALQRDMELFFDTFGELSSEARKTERIVQSF